MTRVLHVLDHSLPLHSGYSFRTRAIMKAQAALGLEVRGLTGLRHRAQGPDVENAEGLRFHRTRGHAGGPAGLREWREVARLAAAIDALCEEWRPDVLHAHSPALCGLAALRVARARGIPLVYEIRAFWEDAAVGNGTSGSASLKYRLTHRLENHVVAGADAVVTICQGLRDDLIARRLKAGTAPERVLPHRFSEKPVPTFSHDAVAHIHIMPNGVDLTLFGTPPAPDPALRRQLGLGTGDSGGPVIGFIGSFYAYEGLDDLIAAMPSLVARHPDARLLLVGGGPCTAALRAAAEASPVAHAIRLIGRVPHAEVARYYALADIMAYPRKASRLTELVTPLKPLEAMAQGKLIAASDVGGHRELITDGLTGTLFAPDSPAACAEALARLLDDRSGWEARRAAARAQVEAAHDWARNAARYRDIYQDVLARRTRRKAAAA